MYSWSIFMNFDRVKKYNKRLVKIINSFIRETSWNDSVSANKWVQPLEFNLTLLTTEWNILTMKWQDQIKCALNAILILEYIDYQIMWILSTIRHNVETDAQMCRYTVFATSLSSDQTLQSGLLPVVYHAIYISKSK